MNNFSPNMIKTYVACPRKYYFKYIENINLPQSSLPFEKGKKIHAIANYFLQGINIDRIKTALKKDEEELWEKLKQNLYYQKDYYKSEFSLLCKIENFWIGGRIDAVVHDFEDYYILDYKTGMTPEDPVYDFQTMIYLMCIDKYLKNYNRLFFVYINLKDNKNDLIEFSQSLKRQYIKKVTNICTKISNDGIYKCNTSNCKLCEYKKLCL